MPHWNFPTLSPSRPGVSGSQDPALVVVPGEVSWRLYTLVVLILKPSMTLVYNCTNIPKVSGT